MSSIYLFQADQLKDRTDLESVVGTKGANLLRLDQSGFVIPPSLFLSTDAYRHFLITNGLPNTIRSIADDKDLPFSERARRIENHFAESIMPSELARGLEQACHNLIHQAPSRLVVARSSALDEDSKTNSFAGVYSTVLGVASVTELLNSIRKCWMSLWSAHAMQYRLHKGLQNIDIAMGVIIQHQVIPSISGVVFSVNPVTAEEELVVELVVGSGEPLMMGKAMPERFLLDKVTCEIKEHTQAGARKSSIREEQLLELADVVLEVEKVFHLPVDIEFALVEDRIYLLQFRPISSLAVDPSSRDDEQDGFHALLERATLLGRIVWTQENVGEVIPKALTALSWSLLEPMGNEGFRWFLNRLGLSIPSKTALFREIRGKVFFNRTLFHQVMEHLSIQKAFANQSVGKNNIQELLTSTRNTLQIAMRAFVLVLSLPVEAVRVQSEIRAEIKNHHLYSQTSMGELWEQAEAWIKRTAKIMRTHLAVTFLSTVFYALLDSYLKKSISLDIETSSLLSAQTGMRSAQLGRDLSELAKLLQAQPGLLECLQSSKGIRLEDCLDQTPEAIEFNTSFHEFLSLHGHASMEEYELAAPRWREEPGYVLTLILSILRVPNKTSETSLPSIDQAELHDGIFRVRKSLGLRPQRFFFEILLFWTRLYSIYRENLKYHFVLAYGQLREIYLLVAERMVERGMLANHDDLFFLTHEQLGLCINGENGEKIVEEFVGVNREIYTQQISTETDSTIEQSRIFEEREDGSIHPIHVRADDENYDFSTREVLSGVPASAGHVIGQARVIGDSLDFGVIGSGEILVTHSTNPAWAPLLHNAGGLVTNVGGLLSHGAILAREYGLPAVLNVRGATELITSGEWIEIDGGRGTVKILTD